MTKIDNHSVMHEFSVPTNVCGMLVLSAETTWHNWLQGVNKESWYQTELIGVLFSAWLALDEFKLVFRSMYCECLACTKEKIELWEIQYGHFKLMIHIRMTYTAPITADGDSDQRMSFHIPEFEYSNSSFLLIKRIMLERNFSLHTDLQNRMEVFPTPGYLHAELEDLNDVSYYYNHKRKRYNNDDDIYSSVNDDDDSSSSASTLSEASSSSDEPVDWSEEPPLKKVPNQAPFYRIRSPFEDMNGHYQALNLNSMSRDNEVKNTQDVMELVTAKLVENYQRRQKIEKSVGFLDMLQDPTI